MSSASSVDHLTFHGRDFYVKRDELIDPLLSGNKYRKLYSLIQRPAEQHDIIISFGGTQSNAMLSLAALCRQKGWVFHYTSKPVPLHLKDNLTGNLKMALELGMQLHEVALEDYGQETLRLKSQRDDSTLFVPQGGADPLAQGGIEVLAEEIKQWQQEHDIETLNVVTPSGTGTTAYYLASALPDVTVLTTAVVGDKPYLESQMEMLGGLPLSLRILENRKKYHFAKPYPEFLAIYQELQEAGIEFDLIYAPKMWHTLLQQIDSVEGDILYVHSGGLFGNESMLDRYCHKGF